MIRFNGRVYKIKVINGNAANVVSQSIGGRTAIACTATSGLTRGYLPHGMGGAHLSCGALSASTDVVKNALIIDAWLCFPTLAGLASGSWTTILWTAVWTGGGTPTPGTYFNIYVQVYFDGTTYHLYLVRKYGTVSEPTLLGTIAQGTTYHRITAWILTDKAYTSMDGADPTETAYAGGVPTVPVYPDALYLEWNGGTCSPAWDAFRMDLEEYDSGTAAGTSRTNGHQDNGTLFLIEKTALEALISAGTAYALSITNGTFDASAVTADKDYLAVKVLSDNLGGYGLKINKSAAGAVIRSNWSL